jgi:peptidoglycan hydrolase CwlO-like protein
MKDTQAFLCHVHCSYGYSLQEAMDELVPIIEGMQQEISDLKEDIVELEKKLKKD